MTTPVSRPMRATDAFGYALAAALQWRLLLVWTIGLIVPTAIVAVSVRSLLGSILDYSPRSPEIARHFDLIAMSDVGASLEHGGGAAVSGAAMVAMMITLLLSPFLTGMTIAALRAERPLGFLALVQGADAWLGRMFRMLLVSLIPLGVVAGLATAAFKIAGKHAQKAILESQADRASSVATIVTLLLFVIVHATIEAGRAELATDEQLRSAWRAWFRGVKRTIERPLAVLGLYLGPTLVAFAVALVLVLVRVRVTPSSGGKWVIAFIITQLAVAAIGWGRASRLFALASITKPRA